MKGKKFKVALNEARRPVKCKVIDWAPLEETVIYTDMIAMGWERVTTAQRQLMGNLQFYHEDFAGLAGIRRSGFPRFKINHHSQAKDSAGLGTIMVEVNENLSYELNNTRQSPITAPSYRRHEHLIKQCATWEDYIPKMNFLMKLLLKKKGVFPISDDELYSTELYGELIKRRCKEDASLYNKIEDRIPPSVKDIEKKAKLIKGLKLFGDEPQS